MNIGRKEPTPSGKSDISIAQADQFLTTYYPHEVSDVQELGGGKHSKAFSYTFEGKDFIVRFNHENRGFLKDKYAFEQLGKEIPVPQVLDIGMYDKDIHYCITNKIPGETARDQYKREDYSSIPLLYDAVEKIATINPAGTGYGYLDLDGNAPYSSSLEYIRSVYRSKELFDWDNIFKMSFVDKKFTDYVAERMGYFAQYATTERELLHGDFGADNIFVKDNKINGIIDWEKMRCGDHFLDIGRVLLFCPNRKATTDAAIEFYKDKGIKNWKERTAMGVYHVILTNYAYAALGENEVSCKSSGTRLKELEQGLNLD